MKGRQVGSVGIAIHSREVTYPNDYDMTGADRWAWILEIFVET